MDLSHPGSPASARAAGRTRVAGRARAAVVAPSAAAGTRSAAAGATGPTSGPARGRRLAQRGSQSLEWVALGGLVASVMVAATKYIQSDGGLGAAVAQAIVKPVRDMLGGFG